MRWDRLFADLEAQAEAVERAGLDAEVADRTRRELARVQVVDRLRAAGDRPLTCRVLGAGTVSGTVAGLGADWVLLAEDGGRELVVPLGSLLALHGLGPRADVPAPRMEARLRLGHVLRGVARDRTPVQVVLTDATTVAGTVDGVGADHLDLAQHATGEARRPRDVRGVLTVPFVALGAVRRA